MTKHNSQTFGDEAVGGERNVNEESRSYSKLCYSAEETAGVLGIGIQAIYKLLKLGIIPSFRVNQKYLIPVSALEEALDNLVGKEIAV